MKKKQVVNLLELETSHNSYMTEVYTESYITLCRDWLEMHKALIDIDKSIHAKGCTSFINKHLCDCVIDIASRTLIDIEER